MRITVGTIVGLLATGRSNDEILREYPHLEAADIDEALSDAAWRTAEVEVSPRAAVSLLAGRPEQADPDARRFESASAPDSSYSG
jgi:Protein of unknown function (DUF433)